MYVVLFVAIAALYLPAGWQAPAYEYAKETMDSVVESATAFITSFAKAEPEVPPDLVRVGFHL
jgi:hypothetical protein